MTATDPTTVCLLTAEGRGAVAVIAVSGPNADAVVAPWFRSASGWAVAEIPVGRIAFGRWGAELGEEVVLVRLDAGIEIHCHGGAAASRAIVNNLVQLGAHAIPPNAWVASQSPDAIVAAASVCLGKVATERAALVLLDQLSGALSGAILHVLKLLEQDQSELALDQLQTLAERWPLGRRLTEPARVVLTGPPNVGKSSLINALVGYERAIVFDTPGTTRDVVTASTAIDGWSVELVDTAGLRSAAEGIEQAGIELAQQQLAEADLVVLVGEATDWLAGKVPAGEFASWWADRPLLRVANKGDQLTEPERQLLSEQHPPLICTSAVDGWGVPALLEAVAEQVVPKELEPQAAVPFTLDQQQAIVRAMDHIEQGEVAHAQFALQQLLQA